MEFPNKQLLVVGDRVLITPEEGKDRTRVALSLPPPARATQQLPTGLTAPTRPADPVAALGTLHDEPWKICASEPRSRALPATTRDYAVVLRKGTVPATFQG